MRSTPVVLTIHTDHPFAAVRWEEKTPFVLVDEKWYEYISIDGV